jgi:hypothetical protein
LAEAESEGEAPVSSLARFLDGEAAAPGGGPRRLEEVELMAAGTGGEMRGAAGARDGRGIRERTSQVVTCAKLCGEVECEVMESREWSLRQKKSDQKLKFYFLKNYKYHHNYFLRDVKIHFYQSNRKLNNLIFVKPKTRLLSGFVDVTHGKG